MWKYENDGTPPVITAKAHIQSSHETEIDLLPKTAILFYMHGGVVYINNNYDTELISDKLPCFLNSRPVYKLKNKNICFLHGGWGAPMAADTVETLSALGVKTIVSVGMFGAFVENINSGDIIIPSRAFVEEGTSLHYFQHIESAFPDEELLELAVKYCKNARALPIVTTDSVYRQTFFKENLWRQNGAVGVDMESSAIFSIGAYLGVGTLAILIASDKHLMNNDEKSWEWTMTNNARCNFFDECIKFSLKIQDV